MPFDHRGVVDVGVHVPDEVRRHRHEAAAALAEPAGQQQQLAQRLRVVDVVVVVLPLLADGVGPDERGRVVAGDEAGSSRVRSKASARPPEEAIGLLAEPVDALDCPCGLQVTRGRVQQGEEVAAVVEPFAWETQLEPFGAAFPLARVERGVGRGERAGRVEAAERRGARPRRRVDRPREEHDVGGQARARVVRPGDPCVDRAEVGPERVAADDRLDVVVGVAGDERADDGELVGPRREAGEGAAEGHAGDLRGDLARGAADSLGPIHLRVERLDLARAAVQEEEDDRLPRQQPRHPFRVQRR